MPNQNFTELVQKQRAAKVSPKPLKNPSSVTAQFKTRNFPGVPGKERDRSLGVKQGKVYPQKEGF